MSRNSDGPQKLMKNSKVRLAIFELMLLYNQRLQEAGYIDFRDLGLLALEQARKHVAKHYTHILIDESQDLSRIQLEFLKLLYRHQDNSSFTFITDTAQSIYHHSWLVKGRNFTSIDIDMTGKSSSLTKNYRTTTQIAQAAYSLLESDTNIIDDENFVRPALIDRQGIYPVYKHFRKPEDEGKYVAHEVKNNLLLNYSLKDIVIIAKTKNQLQHIKDCLDKEKIAAVLLEKTEFDFEIDAIKLLTMHSIKGLEFKVVFIIGLNDGVIPYNLYSDLEDHSMDSTDRKLLYVGMTRAHELLYLTSSGKPSKFINDINPKLMRISPNALVKKFYPVMLEDFLIRDKITNIYSHEEKVRQWLINELIETYRYPLELIDVEYRVNNFSQAGAVDIVVSIERKDMLTPFIFVEIKSYGSGVESALPQLKSYMSSTKTCQYGIATDGNDFVILDQEFNIVPDIPMCDSSMLPTNIEKYCYLDFKYQRKYQILKDSDSDEIFIEDCNAREAYTPEQTVSLAIYSNIAAGTPILVGEDVTMHFPLPTEWFLGKEECFLMTVKGDSMVGANIDDGDIVVVQRSQIAQNRDITVVAIDEEATLKRFMSMGDTILLIPENEQYEPILMNSEQVRVVGVALGVIKRTV